MALCSASSKLLRPIDRQLRPNKLAADNTAVKTGAVQNCCVPNCSAKKKLCRCRSELLRSKLLRQNGRGVKRLIHNECYRAPPFHALRANAVHLSQSHLLHLLHSGRRSSKTGTTVASPL